VSGVDEGQADDLLVLGPTGGAFHRPHQAVDAIAGIAVDPGDIPLAQAGQDEVGDGLAHEVSPRQRSSKVVRIIVTRCLPRAGGDWSFSVTT